MVHVHKGEYSNQALILMLVIVGFLVLFGIAVVLIVVIGQPAALNSVPLIGDAMCQLLGGLGVQC